VPPAYELDGIAGFSKNSFLAVSEADDIADFFMLDSLQVKLAERLKEQLRPLAFKFQFHRGLQDTEEIHVSAFGSGFYGLHFWEYFSQGVTHLYDSEYDTAALLDVFREFGVWTLESVLLDDLYRIVKMSSRFVAEVFYKIRSETLEILVKPRTKCQGCHETVFEGGRHFTRIYWPGIVISCSGCHQG